MEGAVRLAHGAGGRETGELLEELLFSRVEEGLKRVEGGLGIDFPDDGAAIPVGDGYIVVSVDSYTVKPPFFPGGDIGKLAACGSINDVVMMGAKPIAIMDAIVVEEGFPLRDLERLVNSFISVIRSEGVALVGGDFKVMPRGGVDGVVISTVALGRAKRLIVDKNVRPGDKIVVTGYLGDHGATIMALQHGLEVSGELKSDVQSLSRFILPVLDEFGDSIHAARDPTRGGLAMLLNDWARASGTVIVVNEANIPLRREVKSYAEMLGIDPLALASEGVAVLAVDPADAEDVVERLRSLGCEQARIIGEARESERFKGIVLYASAVGGLRILEPPMGEIVPRIC